MSALIRQLVLRKRTVAAEAACRQAAYESLVADARGEPGPQGAAGEAPEHEWDGTKLRFKKPDGSWGEWVDLRGKPGKKGDKGDAGGTVIVNRGARGSAGTGGDFGSLPSGDPGTVPEAIAFRQNGEWVQLGWEQFVAMLPVPAGVVTVTLTD